ncbi:MAG TPA: ABC transporter ATP-binding protein [Acidimicrobiales bacterium]|nr:ABC transporter ATP-binding protein [Acidimicrobiales bacterium]
MTTVEAVPASPRPDAGAPLLSVDALTVEFATPSGWVPVVQDVAFDLSAGETLGLVGESGSGKTVTSLAVLGLLPRRSARITSGTIRLDGRDIRTLTPLEKRRIRGHDISMIFQEPMTSLNPAFTVGNQIAESVRIHLGLTRRDALTRAAELLALVGIPDPHRRVRDYPHTFSGGMRQRVMIAMAIACNPRLLVADEPTTALDVTVQAQVLELLRRLQDQIGMGVLFVTHDLGVVANVCDRVVVLYAGQVVERADAARFFTRPGHPYAEGLLASLPQTARPGSPLAVIPGEVPRSDALPPGCRFHPRCRYAQPACSDRPVDLQSTGEGGGAVRCLRQGELDLTRPSPDAAGTDTTVGRPTPGSGSDVVLQVSDLSKTFPSYSSVLRRVVGHVTAVDGVDLTIRAGETVGLVGESGSGKSTLARLVMRLIDPSAGRITLGATDLTSLAAGPLRRVRRDMQMVFQDPYSSLNPMITVGQIVAEPLEVHDGLRGRARHQRVAELLVQVGLGAEMVGRYPHQFSGGQRQRIAIARALALNPRLLVCDEPVSSLDVSTQSQVINLLADLQERLGLSCLFIAHDLSVVRHISHRIAVMYLGRILESGPVDEVYSRPVHPYTEALLSAIPVPEHHRAPGRTRLVLRGDPPSPLHPPTGCRFHTRCPYAMDMCAEVEPTPFETAAGTTVACHLHRHGPVLAGRSVTLLDAQP